MKPIYLYMENFMRHDLSEIDFTSFNSALIVAKLDGNDSISNGFGKSTIFRAIQFVLFNECKNVKLERVIRDDTNKARVVIDFSENGKIYRVSRSRNLKGVTDLTLLERTAFDDPNVNPHIIFADKTEQEKFWKDISGRRVPDTEEVLHSIHKMNYKAFCNGYYFAQHDFSSGLASATKSDRKKILKESLQLVIYTHLYKLASARASTISRTLDKKKAVLDSMGDPSVNTKNLYNKLANLEVEIEPMRVQIDSALQVLNQHNATLTTLKAQRKTLSEQVDSVLKKSQLLTRKVSDAQKSIDDLNTKRKNTVSIAKTLDSEIKSLKEKKILLLENDFSKINEFKSLFDNNKQIIANKNGLIQSYQDILIELRLPLPDEVYCKHCRQPLTQEHIEECEKSTNQEIVLKESKILELKNEIAVLVAENKILNESGLKLESLQKELTTTENSIVAKIKEVQDKKTLYSEYDSMLKKSMEDLEASKLELEQAQKEVEASSSKELDELSRIITSKTEETAISERSHLLKNEQLNRVLSEQAILNHSIQENEKAINLKAELVKEVNDLEIQYESLPDCLEAFGPTGIPNFIIQTLLDDLQIESNAILEKAKPGLQLSFSIEKVKGDGQIDDDLDINYFMNGRERDYGVLGGAEQMSIIFALKLGVASMLKKTLGSSFEMLLLDEIDAAFDESGADEIAEVIKNFQNDYTMLVITHNNRLKDKFSHAILVQCDKNGISRAKVVTSW